MHVLTHAAPAHTRPIDAESSCASIAHRSGMMGWAPPTPRCLDHPGPPWTTLDHLGPVRGGPAWSTARQPGDTPRRPWRPAAIGAACRCGPLRRLRFDPAACLAERTVLSARRGGRPDWTPTGPPWTRLDHPGPHWTRGGGPEVGDLKSPESAIAPLCGAIRDGRAGLDHWTTLFSFFIVSIIITATPTHRTCPAEAWWAADPRRAAEVRSSHPPKRCAEGWSTGPLLSRPAPIADLTRAMCVSGDSVHFRSGPPPAAEVVQWTRHLVQSGPLPAEPPTGAKQGRKKVWGECTKFFPAFKSFSSPHHHLS